MYYCIALFFLQGGYIMELKKANSEVERIENSIDYWLSIKELEIEKCRFYDLRGSYATRILTNGVEIRDVADILEHRNIETTENYYISSTDDSRKRANRVFEKMTQSSIINEIIKYKV